MLQANSSTETALLLLMQYSPWVLAPCFAPSALVLNFLPDLRRRDLFSHHLTLYSSILAGCFITGLPSPWKVWRALSSSLALCSVSDMTPQATEIISFCTMQLPFLRSSRPQPDVLCCSQSSVCFAQKGPFAGMESSFLDVPKMLKHY